MHIAQKYLVLWPVLLAMAGLWARHNSFLRLGISWHQKFLLPQTRVLLTHGTHPMPSWRQRYSSKVMGLIKVRMKLSARQLANIILVVLALLLDILPHTVTRL